MRGNGKVFISHLHEDNARCKPILDALKAWGVNYWFDIERLRAGQALSDRIQSAVVDCDIFLRVCTSNLLRHGFWVDEETNAFRALQADDEKAGRIGKRTLITIVMDTYYVPQPFEKAHIYIDAARQPLEAWLQSLRRVVLPEGSGSSSDVKINNPIIVDWQHTGDYARISRAIEAAQENQLIVVKPGQYRETLRINKNVEIRGEGKQSEIVVIIEGADVVTFQAASGKISNLSLRQMGGKGKSYGVDVASGQLEISDCDITSQSLAGVGVHGKSRCLISRCRVHASAQSGLYFYEDGTGLVEDTEIVRNALHGVAVHGRSQPTLRNCHISENVEDGIYISDQAAGFYEGNTISANHLSGIVVAEGRNPIFRGNTIHDNGAYGLRVHHGGGTFEGNDFRHNKGGAKDISPESIPSVRYTNNVE